MTDWTRNDVADVIRLAGVQHHVDIPNIPYRFGIEPTDTETALHVTGTGVESDMYVRIEGATIVEITHDGFAIRHPGDDERSSEDHAFFKRPDVITDAFTLTIYPIGPDEPPACSHGYEPPERCPWWPHG